jgi:N-methylhydantoinase A
LEPTVTDADVVLARIDPASFAGGRVPVHAQLARDAMARAGPAGTLRSSVEEFAYAIDELVDESMSNAARVHAVENGKTLTERTLIAFGGAAPLHVGRVAEKLAIARVIVPPAAGVGSAVGFLLAPMSYEVSRSMYWRLANFHAGRINALLSSMAEDARGVVARGAEGKVLIEQRTAFARYLGQGYEIAISLPPPLLRDSDAATLRKAFEQSYLGQYGRLIEGIDIEILAWTVTVSTVPPEVGTVPSTQYQPAAPASAWREVFDVGQGAWVKSAVYRRGELPPGSALPGPAIIVEESTSTVVGPHYDAAIAADGSIVMSRRI